MHATNNNSLQNRNREIKEIKEKRESERKNQQKVRLTRINEQNFFLNIALTEIVRATVE